MLQNLEIFALRGATEKLIINFEKGKNMTILYGENGSGKSTVCDALELLSKGRIGSLEGKGLGKTESYWHSTGKKPTDIRVVLTATDGQWTATVSKSKVVCSPSPGRPHSEILRRSQLQKLISDQPKNRFDTVRPFLDIDTIEISENNLKRLIDEEKRNQQVAVARIEENMAAVENFWKQSGSPGKNALDWAQIETKKETKQLESEINQLTEIIKQIEKIGAEKEKQRFFIEKIQKAEETLKEKNEEVQREQSKVSAQLAEVMGILEAAQKFFQDHIEPDVCPLCGSSEFAQGLPDKVKEQLVSIRALTEALRLEREAKNSLNLAINQKNQQTEDLFVASKAFSASINSDLTIPNISWPEELKKIGQSFKNMTYETPDPEDLINELLQKGNDYLQTLKTALDTRKEQKGFIETLRTSLEYYNVNYQAQKELETLIPRLEIALVEIQKERRSFVDNILRKISTRVGQLYEEIHPGEGLSKIGLLLDPDKRASLEIMGPFPGTNGVPPGAYFSDSHLDTLGFCIWLAIAEFRGTEDTIFVLDDIVASTDEPHVERLIEVLYEISKKFRHCICTTHYRPWREKYRWGWLQNGECQFIELLPWQHKTGIKHSRHLPPVEDLRALLTTDSPKSQLVCASAAVILEAILDFLTQLYECSVPRRKARLTLGDLLPSMKPKLRKALKVECQEKTSDGSLIYKEYFLGPILDEIERIAQIRNVFGCHFNELSYQLPEQDSLRFSKAVLELADQIIDIGCGWPKSDKSGSYWANSNQTRRLHPLKQPS